MMSVQHHAALIAWYTKKPVKVKFTRQESLAYHTKRHPMEIEITTGCDENGILQGMKATIIADTGAYASLGGPVLDRACTHAAECLEAVKDLYEANPRAGLALGWKNSGKGVGIIDTGRCKLLVKGGKVHVLTSAACMGQGIAIMCETVLCEATGISPKLIVHEAADTRTTPNAGTSTASRQTVVTGEATKRAAELLKADLDAGKTLADLEGKEYFGEYHPMTDGLTSTKEFPIRHVSYSYGVQVVIPNEEGRVEKVVAAYDVGTPVNLQAVEGQIPLAFGAKGCGELCMIPTGAACAHAYYKLDGKERRAMPIADTYYNKNKKK